MIYRKFGKAGLEVSLIGMGGMRFCEEDVARGDLDACAQVVLHAYERGVNYFDTAPKYCQDKSLEIVGRALRQMPRDKVYITSKAAPENTGEQNADELLRSIERHIKRLGTDYIDFFHLWCVLDFAMFERYERMGMIHGLQKAKELGLIRHISLSTHASGEDVRRMLETGYFEGCLLNYNAANFAFRQEGIKAAGRLGVGVVTMNPLGGGLIPRNPEFFSFLKRDEQDTAVKGAVRFNASHPELNVVLIGATKPAHIDEACDAIEGLQPVDESQLDSLKSHLLDGMGSLCTMCGYCAGCPKELSIPKLMDAYNQYILSGHSAKAAASRLDMHWDIPYAAANECISCGACERKCTQHLPIIARMREIYTMCSALQK